MRSQQSLRLALVVAALAGLLTAAALLGFLRILIALAAGYAILRVGSAMLRGMARPLPEPPEAGELRKVKIHYRCSVCGAEVRMTVAPDEDPEPPRHCQDEMDLVAPIE